MAVTVSRFCKFVGSSHIFGPRYCRDPKSKIFSSDRSCLKLGFIS